MVPQFLVQDVEQLVGGGRFQRVVLRGRSGRLGRDRFRNCRRRRRGRMAYQRWFKEYWGYTGTIDGIAGSGTKAAFKRFANDNGVFFPC